MAGEIGNVERGLKRGYIVCCDKVLAGANAFNSQRLLCGKKTLVFVQIAKVLDAKPEEVLITPLGHLS